MTLALLRIIAKGRHIGLVVVHLLANYHRAPIIMQLGLALLLALSQRALARPVPATTSVVPIFTTFANPEARTSVAPDFTTFAVPAVTTSVVPIFTTLVNSADAPQTTSDGDGEDEDIPDMGGIIPIGQPWGGLAVPRDVSDEAVTTSPNPIFTTLAAPAATTSQVPVFTALINDGYNGIPNFGGVLEGPGGALGLPGVPSDYGQN